MVFGHGQRRDVADPAFVEIAGRGVMRRMRTAPVIIWRQCEDAEDAASPVIRLSVGEERTMAAIMLDHEQAKQEACGRNDQHESPPETMMHRNSCNRPKTNKRDERHR